MAVSAESRKVTFEFWKLPTALMRQAGIADSPLCLYRLGYNSTAAHPGGVATIARVVPVYEHPVQHKSATSGDKLHCTTVFWNSFR